MTDPKKINADTSKYSDEPTNQIKVVKKLAKNTPLEDIKKTGRQGAGTNNEYRTYQHLPVKTKKS